jgi:hypothetical protein
MEGGKAKALRPGGDGHSHWQRPLQNRPGQNPFGKDITYVRDPNYWAKDLNVRRGSANFDRITVKIYKDNTARLEALKAGEFDLMRFFSAGDWARRVTWQAFDTGELVKTEFKHRCHPAFRATCSIPGATSSRMCGCARPWAWRWTTSG